MSVALANWGRSLIALALFGLLVELLLPSRATEGYVRLIIGLVLLTAVVSPILGVARSVVGGGLAALPGSAATSLNAVLNAESRPPADEPSLVAGVFAGEVRQSVVARVRTMPGVAAATARVVVGRDASTYGEVLSVSLTLRPTLTAARDSAALARRTVSDVADALGIAPARVHVVVLRPQTGPAP
jgi:stage III sporulation protein AF